MIKKKKKYKIIHTTIGIGEINNSFKVIGIVIRKGVERNSMSRNVIEIVNKKKKQQQEQPPIETIFEKRTRIE